MELIFLIGLILSTSSAIDAKILIIPEPKLTSCSDWKRINGQGINLTDTSNLEIVRVNETHSFYKGSIKFLKDLERLPGNFFYEKFSNGNWVMLGFAGKYGDFCRSYHDRTLPFHYTMDHFVKCPIKAGTEWVFDMIPFTLMYLNIDTLPPHYIGRWRMVTVYEVRVNEVERYNCRRIYFEIVETEKSKKSTGSSGTKNQRSG